MQVEIMYRPSYSLAVVKLGPGESIRTEAGAMVSMSPGLSLETKAQGGLLASLKRSVLGGESFFVNTYKAPSQGGEITLAPVLPGDMVVHALQNETLVVQSGSYIASSEGVNIDAKWGGAKTFFASEGLIMLKASGTGSLLLSSYGAIHEVNLAAGQSYTVDTGHLVAFTDGMGFQVRRVGGLKSTLFSGEGLVVDLSGPGRVLLQTRSQDAFLSWLLPKLPTSDPGGGGKGFQVKLG
ncbi:MAG: TIGR00266 family protein [Chloroflexota bacterium]|nr:TIGR00266 family protein [Chloroflexota bacterium]